MFRYNMVVLICFLGASAHGQEVWQKELRSALADAEARDFKSAMRNKEPGDYYLRVVVTPGGHLEIAPPVKAVDLPKEVSVMQLKAELAQREFDRIMKKTVRFDELRRHIEFFGLTPRQLAAVLRHSSYSKMSEAVIEAYSLQVEQAAIIELEEAVDSIDTDIFSDSPSSQSTENDLFADPPVEQAGDAEHDLFGPLPKSSGGSYVPPGTLK